jgi:cytosine/uracil/thiamine/allantoin permease
MKRLKGLRTLITSGVFMMAGGAVTFYDAMVAYGIHIETLLPKQIPVEWAAVIAVAISFVFGALRFATNTAPFKRDAK